MDDHGRQDSDQERAHQEAPAAKREGKGRSNAVKFSYSNDSRTLCALLPRSIKKIYVVCGHQSATKADFRNEFKYPQRHKLSEIYVNLLDPHDIARGIRKAPDEPEAVLVIHRGGGNAQEFDHLAVVQAVSDCPLPVITAVGHYGDIYAVDRIATAAMSTPTKAGRLLSEVLTSHYYRDRRANNEPVPVANYPAATPPRQPIRPPHQYAAPLTHIAQPPPKSRNSLGTASFVLGIVAALTAGGLGIVPIVGLILGLCAVPRSPRALAIIGITFNSIILTLVVAYFIWLIAQFSSPAGV